MSEPNMEPVGNEPSVRVSDDWLYWAMNRIAEPEQQLAAVTAECHSHLENLNEQDAKIDKLEQQLAALREALEEATGWNWLDGDAPKELEDKILALLKEG